MKHHTRSTTAIYLQCNPDSGLLESQCRIDARHAESLIDGKVYYYSAATNEEMKYDDLKPGRKEYQRRAWLSENTIWLYKDNYGLSSAKTKRTEAGMVKRESHELSKPACPLASELHH